MVLNKQQRNNRARIARLRKKGFRISETPTGQARYSLTKGAAERRIKSTKKIIKKHNVEVKAVPVTLAKGGFRGIRKGSKVFVFAVRKKKRK